MDRQAEEDMDQEASVGIVSTVQVLLHRQSSRWA